MNYRKSFWALLSYACCLCLFLISCDDDEKSGKITNEITVDKEVVEHGIETDMQSAIIDLKVDVEGEWIAYLDSKADWIMLGDNEMVYNGSKILRLVFDENLSGSDRQTTLYIADADDDITEIKIRQNYNYKGEAPDNGSGLAFSQKGLGCGIDYDYVLDTKSIRRRSAIEDAKIASGQMKADERTKFEPTKVKKNNNVFNIAKIEQLIANGVLEPSTYSETVIEVADLQATMLDSALIQDKTVDLTLTLGVSFGVIEFEASAKYNSTKTESRAHVDYTVVRNAPIYNVVLSEAAVSTYAEDVMFEEFSLYEEKEALIEKKIENYYKINKKEELKPSQQKIIDGLYNKLQRPTFGGVFSASFAKSYFELYQAVADEDYETADKVLNTIDDLYGPFYIGGGDFGGALVMHCLIDTMRMVGDADFIGHLNANLAGLFEVTGDFKYHEEGFNVLHESNTNFYIYGGSANETADNLWRICMSENPDDRGQWQQTLLNWINSMYSPDNQKPDMSKASPLSFMVVPVWSLFSDAETHEYAQQYFLNKYESRGIYDYFGIMNGTSTKTADDLISEYSE